ncbi:serine/threonine-protein kinase [Streptomyces sp. NPDC047097]|uniref:serine/threonine-protein kinase n=1 Tax=Streptomyces sp. NPDC047097 TaxID=3155260 RepID=UPI0033F7C44D
MRPLRPGDPDRVGPYRTLARLGAGGMGTVYLARAPGGAVAAVKVIHTGRASDPDYRARFRREVAAARSVDSPWTTPLLAADPDGPAPWLATAYVPGPSLGEAVETHGPLPEHTVRLLGARLAHALGAVHRVGLVHRDVKPGNVLLTLDGPRLIDFGIARSSDATALTATGAIVGSPGFLAPSRPGPAARTSARPAMSSRSAASSPTRPPAPAPSAEGSPRPHCCAPSPRNPTWTGRPRRCSTCSPLACARHPPTAPPPMRCAGPSPSPTSHPPAPGPSATEHRTREPPGCPTR